MPQQLSLFGIEAEEEDAYREMQIVERDFVPDDRYEYAFQTPIYKEFEEQWRRLRNTCPTCERDDHLERRNYDMMWGEADLYCGRCDRKIRNMDFG